jgi:hypothetical protein
MPPLVLARVIRLWTRLRHVQASAGAAREATLLIFVAGLTFQTTSYGNIYWAPVDTTHRSAVVAVTGASILLSILRLRYAVLALLGVAAIAGWYPSVAAALALTAFRVGNTALSARRRIAALIVAALEPVLQPRIMRAVSLLPMRAGGRVVVGLGGRSG